MIRTWSNGTVWRDPTDNSTQLVEKVKLFQNYFLEFEIFSCEYHSGKLTSCCWKLVKRLISHASKIFNTLLGWQYVIYCSRKFQKDLHFFKGFSFSKRILIFWFLRDPLARPSQDWYDLDPWDGKVTAVCQENGVSP